MTHQAPLRAFSLVGITCLTACQSTPYTQNVSNDRPLVQAVRLPADASITLDGRLDEPAWQAAPGYALGFNQVEISEGKAPTEGGIVRLLWDDDYLYVGYELVDSDVVQEDHRDQQHHYRTGDVVELFLKPNVPGAYHYWEYYSTPHGNKTAFFYPGPGRLGLDSNMEDYHSQLEVASTVDGTADDWRDRDQGWSTEVRVPRAELAAAGVELSPGVPWRILVSRYNYGAYLPKVELTMYPPLPRTSFHLVNDFADLVLIESVDSQNQP